MISRTFLLLATLLIFGVVFTFADSNPDSDLDIKVVDGNNFYEDEEDEEIIEVPDGMDMQQAFAAYQQQKQGEAEAALDAFDLVVEEDEEEGQELSEEELEARAKAYAEQYLQTTNELSSSYYFLGGNEEDPTIYLGDENELLIGITNDYDYEINITAIRASVMHPLEPSYYYIQNCTAQTYFQVVASKDTQTFYYSFVPDAMLEPKDYVIVAHVYYETSRNERRYYPAVNMTQHFRDAPDKWDTQLFFIFFSIFGLIGFTGYLIFTSIKTGKKRARQQQGKVEKDESWTSHLADIGKGGKKKKN